MVNYAVIFEGLEHTALRFVPLITNEPVHVVMEEVATVLTTLHHAEGEDEEAVTTLLELLRADSCHAQRRQIFSNGVVPALLGILRSSDNVGLLAKVVGCFSLMARGSDETRARLAETDVVSLLLGLCLGRNCPEPTDLQVASPLCCTQQ